MVTSLREELVKSVEAALAAQIPERGRTGMPPAADWRIRMDLTGVNAAFAKLHEELNKAVDAEYAARKKDGKGFKGLERLNQAAKAVMLAEQHVSKAEPVAKPKKEKK